MQKTITPIFRLPTKEEYEVVQRMDPKYYRDEILALLTQLNDCYKSLNKT